MHRSFSKSGGVVDRAHLISAVTSNLDRYLVWMQTKALNPASHRYELAKGTLSCNALRQTAGCSHWVRNQNSSVVICECVNSSLWSARDTDSVTHLYNVFVFPLYASVPFVQFPKYCMSVTLARRHIYYFHYTESQVLSQCKTYFQHSPSITIQPRFEIEHSYSLIPYLHIVLRTSVRPVMWFDVHRTKI